MDEPSSSSSASRMEQEDSAAWLKVGKSFQPQRQLVAAKKSHAHSETGRKRSRSPAGVGLIGDGRSSLPVQPMEDEFGDPADITTATALHIAATDPSKKVLFLPNGDVTIVQKSTALALPPSSSDSSNLYVIDRRADNTIPLFLNHLPSPSVEQPVGMARYEVEHNSKVKDIFTHKYRIQQTAANSSRSQATESRYFSKGTRLSGHPRANPVVHTFHPRSSASLNDVVLLPPTVEADCYRFFKLSSDDHLSEEQLAEERFRALQRSFHQALHARPQIQDLLAWLEFLHHQSYLMQLVDSSFDSRKLLTKKEDILCSLIDKLSQQMQEQPSQSSRRSRALLSACYSSYLSILYFLYSADHIQQAITQWKTKNSPSMILWLSVHMQRRTLFAHSSYAETYAHLHQTFQEVEEDLKNSLATLAFHQSMQPSRDGASTILMLRRRWRRWLILRTLFAVGQEKSFGRNEHALAIIQAMLWWNFPLLCDLSWPSEPRELTAEIMQQLWDEEGPRPFDSSLPLDPSGSPLHERAEIDPLFQHIRPASRKEERVAHPAPIAAPQSAGAAATSKQEGEWIYSRVHGYRIFLPKEENSSLAYQKALGQFFTETMARLTVEQETKDETDLGHGESLHSSVEEASRAQLQEDWKLHVRDSWESLRQHRPLSSLSNSDCDAVDRHPERCVLYQDIHKSLFCLSAMPGSDGMDRQSLLISLLQGTGVLSFPLADFSHAARRLLLQGFWTSFYQPELHSFTSLFQDLDPRHEVSFGHWHVIQRLEQAQQSVAVHPEALVEWKQAADAEHCRWAFVVRMVQHWVSSPHLLSAVSLKFASQLRSALLQLLACQHLHRHAAFPAVDVVLISRQVLQSTVIGGEGTNAARDQEGMLPPDPSRYPLYGSVIGDLSVWSQYLRVEWQVNGREEALKVADKAIKSLSLHQSLRVSGRPGWAPQQAGLLRFYHACLCILLQLGSPLPLVDAGQRQDQEQHVQEESTASCNLGRVVQALSLLVQFAHSGALFTAQGQGDWTHSLGSYAQPGAKSAQQLLRAALLSWKESPDSLPQSASTSTNPVFSTGKKGTASAGCDVSLWLASEAIQSAKSIFSAQLEEQLEQCLQGVQHSTSPAASSVEAGGQIPVEHGIEEEDLEEGLAVSSELLDGSHDHLFHLAFLQAYLCFLHMIFAHRPTAANSGNAPTPSLDDLYQAFLQAVAAGHEVFLSILLRLRAGIVASPGTTSPYLSSQSASLPDWTTLRQDRQESVLRSLFPVRISPDNPALASQWQACLAGVVQGCAEQQATGVAPHYSRSVQESLITLERLHGAHIQYLLFAQHMFMSLSSAWYGYPCDSLMRRLERPFYTRTVLIAVLHGLADFPLNTHLLASWNYLTVRWRASRARAAYYRMCRERIYWTQTSQPIELISQVLGEALARHFDRLSDESPVSSLARSLQHAFVSLSPDWTALLESLGMRSWSVDQLRTLYSSIARLLNQPASSAQGCVLLWRLIVHTGLLLHFHVDPIGRRLLPREELMRMCYRALYRCGGCKLLYMDIIGPASVLFARKELLSIRQMMELQGMYARD